MLVAAQFAFPSCECWNAVAAWISAIVAAVALWAAFVQLRGLGSTLRLESLAKILDIEKDIDDRRVLVALVSSKYERELAKSPPDFAELDLLGVERGLRIESYLESLDRLAFCILNNQLGEKGWKYEYMPQLLLDREAYPRHFPQDENSRFPCLGRLLKKWEDEERRRKAK